MELHEKGLSIKEIAETYGLAVRTIYVELQYIADEHGVSREYLLQRPHSEHIVQSRNFEPVKPIDLVAFREKAKAAISSMGETKELVDQFITLLETEGEEACPEDLEEELNGSKQNGL